MVAQVNCLWAPSLSVATVLQWRYLHVGRSTYHMTKQRSDWPELFGMARAKELAQRYHTTLSVAILLVEVVGWERDYRGLLPGWAPLFPYGEVHVYMLTVQ